jgi:predicted murein hydrolase (TIGR00659 family)
VARLIPFWNDPFAHAIFWPGATIGLYLAAKALYRQWPRCWLTPLAVTPALLVILVLSLHTSYPDYIRGTHWLVALLGPATVAFAIPIYEQRSLIRRHWPVLLLGVVVGSATAMIFAWAMASVLGLNGTLRLSLLPSSISTPFAMVVSSDIGGVPDLTAVFVVLTGVIGAAFGEILLARLPFRSTLARGSLLGLGAHGAGTDNAHEIGREEGSIARLVMVLTGLLNFFMGPVLAHYLR